MVYEQLGAIIMTAEIHTYWIPDFMLNWLRERITKLSSKAISLNCEPIRLHETGNIEFKEVNTAGFDEAPQREIFKFIEITLAGNPPKLNGWHFIGVIQHILVGTVQPNLQPFNGEYHNILRLLEGETVPENYRVVENKCDHCQTIRNRTDTYLVRHEDGTIFQVGSSCLKDFTGHQNPQAVAQLAENFLEYLRNLENSSEYGDEFFGGRQERYYEIKEFLAYVLDSINATGFISRRMIQAGETSSTMTTAEMAWDGLRNKPGSIYLSGSDEKMVDAAIEWAKEGLKQPDNDYIWNLAVACSQEYISRREIGLVASLIPVYQRHLEHQEKLRQQNKGTSVYIGQKGEKTKLGKLTLVGVTAIEGYYGPTFIHKFYDCSGNAIVWFTGDDHSHKMEIGVSYANDPNFNVFHDCVATVKDHKEFNGELQTNIIRLKYKNEFIQGK